MSCFIMLKFKLLKKIIYFDVGIGVQQDDQAHSDNTHPFPLIAVTEMAEKLRLDQSCEYFFLISKREMW